MPTLSFFPLLILRWCYHATKKLEHHCRNFDRNTCTVIECILSWREAELHIKSDCCVRKCEELRGSLSWTAQSHIVRFICCVSFESTILPYLTKAEHILNTLESWNLLKLRRDLLLFTIVSLMSSSHVTLNWEIFKGQKKPWCSEFTEHESIWMR